MKILMVLLPFLGVSTLTTGFVFHSLFWSVLGLIALFFSSLWFIKYGRS